MRLIITGGTLLSASGATYADVLINDETIEAILDPRSDIAQQAREGADREISAADCYVMPGGVDVHVHMQMPAGPDITTSDSFSTGTAAAAWGGTTTVIDFAEQPLGTHVRDAVEDRIAEADGQCFIDYGLHLAMGDVTPTALDEMSSIMDEGITTFKYFMAYPGELYSDDGQLLRAMRRTADLGALAMVHAENGIAMDVLREWAGERGDTDPIWHGRTRPPRLEAEAVHRAASLADVVGAPLYVVHVSSAQALEQVRWARERGQNVFAETCPQYLYLTLEEQLDQPGLDGLRSICAPPLRTADNHGSLWHGLRLDDLAIVSTDHCPFCDSEKLLGLDDFRETPNGLGVIEHRMDLLDTGVVNSELSLARWVETCATTPARMFGLYPRKGVISPGSDADIVIYDPAIKHALGKESHHMNMDHSVWEGMDVVGQVRTVLSRGSFVIEDRLFVGQLGHGQYQKRGVSDLIR